VLASSRLWLHLLRVSQGAHHCESRSRGRIRFRAKGGSSPPLLPALSPLLLSGTGTGYESARDSSCVQAATGLPGCQALLDSSGGSAYGISSGGCQAWLDSSCTGQQQIVGQQRWFGFWHQQLRLSGMVGPQRYWAAVVGMGSSSGMPGCQALLDSSGGARLSGIVGQQQRLRMIFQQS